MNGIQIPPEWFRESHGRNAHGMTRNRIRPTTDTQIERRHLLTPNLGVINDHFLLPQPPPPPPSTTPIHHRLLTTVASSPLSRRRHHHHWPPPSTSVTHNHHNATSPSEQRPATSTRRNTRCHVAVSDVANDKRRHSHRLPSLS